MGMQLYKVMFKAIDKQGNPIAYRPEFYISYDELLTMPQIKGMVQQESEYKKYLRLLFEYHKCAEAHFKVEKVSSIILE